MNERFGLYLILTDPVAGYEACAEAAVAAGIRYLQLRMKGASATERLDMARRLRATTRGTDTRFIVNDDLDVAIEVDADGVHLGQTDLSVAQARARWNLPGKHYGLSTHSMEQARDALESQPNLIGIGPVFPTTTKQNAAPVLGVAETARIADATPITSVAIGGITSSNLPELLGAGVGNFCVVGAVNLSADPAAAIQELMKIHARHAI